MSSIVSEIEPFSDISSMKLGSATAADKLDSSAALSKGALVPRHESWSESKNALHDADC
jgi:hypothetical protein